MERKQVTIARKQYDFDWSQSSSSISLAYLFHILTGCGLFFACYRLSPLLALTLTIVLSPTLIRTHLAAEIHRQNRLIFDWSLRLKYFVSSLGVVLLTYLLAGLAFCSVSMLFGLFAVILGGLMGLGDLQVDSAVLGTAGGMVWGMGAAFLAICFAAVKVWKPIVIKESASLKSASG